MRAVISLYVHGSGVSRMGNQYKEAIRATAGLLKVRQHISAATDFGANGSRAVKSDEHNWIKH